MIVMADYVWCNSIALHIFGLILLTFSLSLSLSHSSLPVLDNCGILDPTIGRSQPPEDPSARRTGGGQQCNLIPLVQRDCTFISHPFACLRTIQTNIPLFLTCSGC